MARNRNLRDITVATEPKERLPSDVFAIVSQVKCAEKYTLRTFGRYPDANEVSKYGSTLRKPTASEEFLINLNEAVLSGLAVNQDGQYHLTPKGQDLCTPKGSDCPYVCMSLMERRKAKEQIAKTIKTNKMLMEAGRCNGNGDGIKYQAGRPVFE